MKPISCGEIEIIPIHLPGHTIDHTCFGINGLETIFLVDIDLTRFGPWYGNEVSDIKDFENSIQRVIDLKPRLGISSHLMDPVVEDLDDRLRLYLRHFDDREERVIRHISQGHDTLEKLMQVPTIYPSIPEDVFLVFEEFMLKKHLEILLDDGRVSEDQGVFSIERK
jgi:glyoxylase-like metal-dependent hydrolase (beta-lactamase superfamily II)